MAKESITKPKIMSIDELLDMPLDIPDYQRPYKWTIRNIADLLGDITNALAESKRFESFKYRIGTIIVHNNSKDNSEKYDIVDGQQRIISLVLLKKYLDSTFKCTILNKKFSNRASQNNIHNNYLFIKEWFSLKSEEEIDSYRGAFQKILEVVVISVNRVEEAFQLFDSQNTRGKELDPHDLLKAYHLREMRNDPYEMEHAVTKWEAKDTSKIRELFDRYLFPAWNWSRGMKSRPFTDKEIDIYKGINEGSSYSYAKRASKAMPHFQITESFIAGNDFFEMVDHYITLLQDVKKEIENNFLEINEELGKKHNSAGFDYTKELFYCALLCYYDRFHNFDKMAVKKLFLWAFMLRVDMEHLGFDSINKYAIGDRNERYTNAIAMFQKISLARLHTVISEIQIKTQIKIERKKNAEWNSLYDKLDNINGI